MKYSLPKELLQEVLDYLSKRPAGEVFGMITKIMQLAPDVNEASEAPSEEASQEVRSEQA